MARTVDVEQHARRRTEILDATQHLISTRGYEQTTVRDIRDLVGMSNGTFFHYFASKPAVLQAFVERIRTDTEKPLLPVVRDPLLPALDKLQRFFDTFDDLRTERMSSIAELLQVWYADGNAAVRQRVDDATREQRAPLLAEVIRQGVQERVFTTAYPDESADAVLALTQRMGAAHAALLSAHDDDRSPGDVQQRTARVVTVHAAFLDAIERVLGAPAGCLRRTDPPSVQRWLTALRDHRPAAAASKELG